MINVRLAAIAAAGFVAASSGAVATVDDFVANGAEDNLQIAEKAAPRVHVLRLPRTVFAGVVGNVTVIEQRDGLVLVDAGSSHGAGKRVVAAVKALSKKPVKAVIITHWHNDHPLGLSAVLAEWPDADIISTAQTKTFMEAGELGDIPREPTAEYAERRVKLIEEGIGRLGAFAADESLTAEERREWARAVVAAKARFADAPGTYLVIPRTTFTDRHVIDDNAAPVEALFLGRANTSGDAAVWLPKQRVLIAGDAVVEPIPYMFAMYPSEMAAVLDKMKAMNYKVLVPGHGALQRDARYIDLLIALIRDVEAKIAPAALAGASLEEATAKADFTEMTAAFAGESAWMRYWFNRYALTPLIDSVYNEAKGNPGPQPAE